VQAHKTGLHMCADHKDAWRKNRAGAAIKISEAFA